MKIRKKSTVPRILAAAGLEKNDVRYATGVATADPFLLLTAGKKKYVVVSALEAARVRKACPDARVITPAELFHPEKAPSRDLGQQAVALAKKLGLKTVTAGPGFPMGVARALEENGIRVHLVTSPAFPQRERKSAREIAAIRHAQRAAVTAMRAAIRLIREARVAANGTLQHGDRPLTAEMIKRQIQQVLLTFDCHAEDLIVAVGPQSACPHETGSGPLRAGVPIVLDIFPRHVPTGYWGDLTRTIVRGRASPAVRRMFQAVRAAQQLALSRLRPGCSRRSVQRAVESFFRQKGFETRWSPPGREQGFLHGVGHGIGLDIHEAPGLRAEAGNLKTGHVVTVEPGLYQPGVGGVRLEDTVVITRQGYKILARCPVVLEI